MSWHRNCVNLGGCLSALSLSFLLLFLPSALATTNKPCSGLGSRIHGITPDAYHLFLHPRLMEGSFTGTVSIILNVKYHMKCLPVHIKGLTIHSTELSGPKGVVPLAAQYDMPEYDYWITEAKQDILPGNYNITLRFSGNSLHKMTGLYRSSYRMPNETSDRYLMTTKFEPTDARQAFPCFDEPILKARFTIKVVRPTKGNFIALSNSRVVRERPGPSNNEVTTEFEETPAMSTYLVAAVVSDFQDLGSVPVKSGEATIPLRVYASANLVNGTRFARNVGQAILQYFISYFDIPFPLPKMDMIAIPDFISGAMENWGLITYRETKLVVEEKSKSFNTLRRVAHVVAHELSHQWFGNLVTMKWWDDLWLNEGFARFMEYKGVASLTDEHTEGPLVRLEDAPDLLDLKMSVMAKDGLRNSHPIVMKVSKPEQISEIFDSISYAKGASILMMIEQIMGEEGFKAGVRKYLKNHAFGNAASQDLLSALSQQSNISLTDSIRTWTNQMGFPIVNVKKVKGGYELSQQRFLSDSELKWSPESSPFGYKWDIPICYYTGKNGTPRMIWLKRNDKKIFIGSEGEPWVKFNCKGASYYRTNYDETLWGTLTDVMKTNGSLLDVEDRSNLLDDSFALANAGFLDYAIPLKLSGYLVQERERLALTAGFSNLVYLKNKLGKSKAPLGNFCRKMVKDIFADLLGGYKTLDFTKQQLKREEEFYILQMACKVGIKKCRDSVTDHFRQWVNNQITITPDLRPLIYSTGMRTSGTDDDWKYLFEKYRNEHDPQEKELLMSALVATKNDNLLKKLLNQGINGSIIRSQDFFGMFGRVGGASPVMAWEWYKLHYDELVDKFTLSDKGLGRAVESVANKFSSKKKLADLKDFFRKHSEAGAGAMARRRAMEKIQSNMNFIQRALPSVTKFFNENKVDKLIRTTQRPIKRIRQRPHSKKQKG